MRKAWEWTRLGLAGIGTGILIAVLYLRHSRLSGDSLDQLQIGAIILIGASVVIGIFKGRSETEAT